MPEDDEIRKNSLDEAGPEGEFGDPGETDNNDNGREIAGPDGGTQDGGTNPTPTNVPLTPGEKGYPTIEPTTPEQIELYRLYTRELRDAEEAAKRRQELIDELKREVPK